MNTHPTLTICPPDILLDKYGALCAWIEENNLARPSLWDVEQERKRVRAAINRRAA